MAHVLVVESGPRLGPILQNWPEGIEIDPGLRVTVCHATADAYAVVRAEQVDLVIVSGNEPNLDLVGLIVVCAAHHPIARVVIVSQSPPPEDLLSPVGGLQFVPPDLDSLFTALEASLRASGDEFTLEQATFDEFVALALVTRWSGTLHARGPRKAGYVGVHHGTIVDARYGDLRGERALVELLAQPGGCLVSGPFDRATATATMGVSLRSDLSELRSRIDVRRDLLAQMPDDEPEMSPSELAAMASGAANHDGPSIFDADELAELEEMARDVHIAEPGGRTSAIGPSSSRAPAAPSPSVFVIGEAIEAMLAAGFAWVVLVDSATGEVLGSAGEGYDIAALEGSSATLVATLSPLAQAVGELRELALSGPVALRMIGRGSLVAVGALADGARWLPAQGAARSALTTLLDATREAS
jgi:hypothetical protein